MYGNGDRWVFSPTDLPALEKCEHLAYLEAERARSNRVPAGSAGAFAQLLRRRGEAHERAWIDRFVAEGYPVLLLPDDDEDVHVRETEQAMKDAVPVIHNAALRNLQWYGKADFLVRNDVASSALGNYSYEPYDAKSATAMHGAALLVSAAGVPGNPGAEAEQQGPDADVAPKMSKKRVPYYLQLCAYATLLEEAQGVLPEELHLLLAPGKSVPDEPWPEEKWPTEEEGLAGRYASATSRLMEIAAADAGDTYPYTCEACALCEWRSDCELQRQDDRSPVLIPAVGGDTARRLMNEGVTSVEQMLNKPDAILALGPKVGPQTLALAEVWVEAQGLGRPVFKLAPDSREGFDLLPTPSHGDLFFDIEGDSFVDSNDRRKPGDTGLEYLLGLLPADGRRASFTAIWATTRGQELQAFAALMGQLLGAIERDANMHIYHYGGYERTALRRLSERHQAFREEVAALTGDDGPMVDMLRVTREVVLHSLPGYSLKDVEKLYGFVRSEEVETAVGSVVAFEEWLEGPDMGLLTEIESYNFADCLSTLRLRDWLVGLRQGFG